MNKLLSLRIILPILIGVFSLSGVAVSYYFSRATTLEQMTKKVTMEMRDTLSFMQGAIVQLGQLKQISSINQIISSIASRPDLKVFFIVDRNGNIIESTNFVDEGEGWQSSLFLPDSAMIEKVIDRKTIEVVVNEDASELDGYSVLCIKEQGNILRTNDCGFIFYRLDLGYHKQQALSTLRREATNIGTFVLMGTLFLIFAVEFFVTRRVRILIDVMRRFSGGERQLRSHCWGHDELRSLGDAINSLLDKVISDETKILNRERRLDAVFTAIVDSIIIIDSNGIIQRVNQATLELFGYREEEILGRNVSMLMPAPDSDLHDGYLQHYIDTGEKKIIGIGREVLALTKYKKTFPIELSVSEANLADGRRLFIGTVRDITKRKQMENSLRDSNEVLIKLNRQLSESAMTDSLTGLANRRRFDETLRMALNFATRNRQPLALLMCDVDYFKKYNDHYGHQAGDDCLKLVAECIASVAQRAGDLAARYGGEEFAIILPHTDREKLTMVADQLRKIMADKRLPHEASDVDKYVSLSIGGAVYEPTSDSPPTIEQVIKQADAGLYKAKEAGRNGYQYGADV